MQTLYNAKTGQSIEWNGTLDDFYAASDADQAGQWAGEDEPVVLVPHEIAAAPAPAVEPTVEVHTEEAQANGN